MGGRGEGRRAEKVCYTDSDSVSLSFMKWWYAVAVATSLCISKCQRYLLNRENTNIIIIIIDYLWRTISKEPGALTKT